MKQALRMLVATVLLVAASPVCADDAAIATYKSIAPDTALELAQAALSTCRMHGFQVAIVVLDRFGQTLVLLRDRFAGLPSAEAANDKAYTALSFQTDSGDFARSVQSGKLSAGLTKLPHIVTLTGGLVIEAGGSLLGAVGVAGAPGGDEDEKCAKAGLDAIRDKLDF